MYKRQGAQSVRVDYVTKDGYVAWPTDYIYGKAGENFTVNPVDLSADGYRLEDGQAGFNGVFGVDNRVQFIYDDCGDNILSSISSVSSEQWFAEADGTLMMNNAADGVLKVYAMDGRCVLAQNVHAGINNVILPMNTGMYIVAVHDDSETRVQKICLK